MMGSLTVFAAGAGMLFLLALAAWLLQCSQQRRSRLRNRLILLAARHSQPDQASFGPARRHHAQRTASALERLSSFFGIRSGEHTQGTPHPALILSVSAILAIVSACFAARFVADLAIPLMPVAWVLLCRATFASQRRRRSATLFRQFPDALATIVRTVRVGIPVSEAMRVVSTELPEPTAMEFARLAKETSIGVSLDVALYELARRNALPEYRFFATTLSLQSQTGGGLAETLEELADTIRKRVAVQLRGKALASEARTTAGILAALPFLTGLALWVINPSYFSLLFNDPIGQKILMVAVALLSGGMMVMRTTITRSLS